ncbi:hypothetical protein BHE74_00035492, partial [Ensete ventricosum]
EAHLWTLAYKKAIARLYTRRLWPWHIVNDNLVLRKVEISDPMYTKGKLASNWEGLYRFIGAVGDRTYMLVMIEGKLLSRT